MSTKKKSSGPAPRKPEWWDQAVAGNTTRRLRRELIKRDETLTLGKAIEARITLSAPPSEEEFTPMSVVCKAAKAAGIPVGRVVKASGGERSLDPPTIPELQVYWYGSRKYFRFPADAIPSILTKLSS